MNYNVGRAYLKDEESDDAGAKFAIGTDLDDPEDFSDWYESSDDSFESSDDPYESLFVSSLHSRNIPASHVLRVSPQFKPSSDTLPLIRQLQSKTPHVKKTNIPRVSSSNVVTSSRSRKPKTEIDLINIDTRYVPITKIPRQRKATLIKDKPPDIQHITTIISTIFKGRTMSDIRQVYKLQLDNVGDIRTMTDLEIVVFLIVYFDTQGQYTDSNYHVSLSRKVSLSLIRGFSYDDSEVNKIKAKYFHRM